MQTRLSCMHAQDEPTHYEISKSYQSTGRAHAKVLQDLKVPRASLPATCCHIISTLPSQIQHHTLYSKEEALKHRSSCSSQQGPATDASIHLHWLVHHHALYYQKKLDMRHPQLARHYGEAGLVAPRAGRTSPDWHMSDLFCDTHHKRV